MSDILLILTLLCGPMSAYSSNEQCYMRQNENTITVLYRGKCHVVNSATGKLENVYDANPYGDGGKKYCAGK